MRKGLGKICSNYFGAYDGGSNYFALKFIEQEESDDRSYSTTRCIFGNSLSLDIVSALAGDRLLTDDEARQVDELKQNSPDTFYSSLLYTITHQSFMPSVAESLWTKILEHKYAMSFTLKRNTRITVAALDYLSNLTGDLQSPTVIDEMQMAAIIQLSLRDGLTTLFNHSSCYQQIEAEVSRYVRYGTIASLMMIDIDDFKAINDKHGHVDGDKILAHLGRILKKEPRDSDICCRYGGEEFAVILPATNYPEAAIFAERLRAKVEESMPLGRRVTISIGVASCTAVVTTAQALVEKADRALYKAKTSGKNKVVVCDNSDEIDVGG